MIKFYEDYHKYLIDGLIEIPSVSELVKYATNENYDNVPAFILNKAAEFGTTIHEAIENHFKGVETIFFDEKLNHSYQEFIRLKDVYIGSKNTIEQEIDFNERYAGRIDLLSDGNLIDFKTNYRFDDKLNSHLQWQLGYYKMALESKGEKVNKCYCLYLPKTGKGKWVEIEPISEKELLNNLENYERTRNNRDY